jgi:opacity protein-like surface antigen
MTTASVKNKKGTHLRVKYLLLGTLMLTTLIPQYVFGQEKHHDRDFYITAKPGIYAPQTNDLDGFDTGFNGEIAFGFQPIKYFAVEVGTGYFNTEGRESFAGVIGGRNIVERDELDLHIFPVTVTAKIILPFKKFEFFGLGGVGAYYVWGDMRAKGTIGGVPFYAESDGSDMVVGGHLGLGVHYNITPRFFVGAEGKYLWTSRAEPEEDFFDDSLGLKFKMDGILATAVVGFRF